MDEEALILLRRWVKHDPWDKIDRIANDYGVTTKEIKKRIFNYIKILLEEYKPIP